MVVEIEVVVNWNVKTPCGPNLAFVILLHVLLYPLSHHHQLFDCYKTIGLLLSNLSGINFKIKLMCRYIYI